MSIPAPGIVLTAFRDPNNDFDLNTFSTILLRTNQSILLLLLVLRVPHNNYENHLLEHCNAKTSQGVTIKRISKRPQDKWMVSTQNSESKARSTPRDCWVVWNEVLFQKECRLKICSINWKGVWKVNQVQQSIGKRLYPVLAERLSLAFAEVFF